MKTCRRCGKSKPLDEYAPSRSGNGKEVRHSYCRPCLREYKKEWRAANPDKSREQKRRWRESHPDEVAEYKRRKYQENLVRARERQRAYRAANPDRVAEWNQRRRERSASEGRNAYYKYGLPLQARQQLEERQQGRCALCDRDLARVKVNVDHDHETGRVRGVLCVSCNSRLGWYEARVDRVAAYLAQPGIAPVKLPHRRRRSG